MAGTLVVMADGSLKPIEQVKVGDLVLSKSESNGEVAAKRVSQTFERQAPSTLALTFSNGEVIETTAEHPFYREGDGFTPAGLLAIGNSIVTRAGPPLEITDIEKRSAPATVYNFSVDDFHTYFVGNSALWVHNVKYAKSGLPDDPFSRVTVKLANGTDGPDFDRVMPDGEKWILAEVKDWGGKSNITSDVQKTTAQLERYVNALANGTNLPLYLQDGITKLQNGTIELSAHFRLPSSIKDKVATQDGKIPQEVVLQEMADLEKKLRQQYGPGVQVSYRIDWI